MDTVHECDGQTDRQTDTPTDGQNYDHKDRATQRRTVKIVMRMMMMMTAENFVMQLLCDVFLNVDICTV